MKGQDITKTDNAELLKLKLEDIVFQYPSSKKKTVILTVVLVNTSVDDIPVTVEGDIPDPETLPVAEQTYEILSHFATTNVEAKNFASRLDVQEARQPIHLELRRARTRCRLLGSVTFKVESG